MCISEYYLYSCLDWFVSIVFSFNVKCSNFNKAVILNFPKNLKTYLVIPCKKNRTVHTKWLFLPVEIITQIICPHMELFLHIMYFLFGGSERLSLQTVRSVHRLKVWVCRLKGWSTDCKVGPQTERLSLQPERLVSRESSLGGGKSMYAGEEVGGWGRFRHAQWKYASCTRWTWGLHRLLSRLQQSRL